MAVTTPFRRRARALPDEIGPLRAAVAAFAGGAGASPAVVDDVRLAVTEACTNAVLHAYPGGAGGRPLEVSAEVADGLLDVAVRDWGAGFRAEATTAGLGLGLPLLHSLADEVEVCAPADGGTEVRMRFRLDATGRSGRANGAL